MILDLLINGTTHLISSDRVLYFFEVDSEVFLMLDFGGPGRLYKTTDTYAALLVMLSDFYEHAHETYTSLAINPVAINQVLQEDTEVLIYFNLQDKSKPLSPVLRITEDLAVLIEDLNTLLEPVAGSVTSVNSQTGVVVLTTAHIADSTNKRYVTDAHLTLLGLTSGTNTGDETTATIKTKLGAASGAADGYLTSANWTTFDSKQAGDATLTALAGLGTGANQVPYSTGADTFDQIDLSALLSPSTHRAMVNGGSTIKGFTLGLTPQMTYTTATLTTGRVYWVLVEIPFDEIITGFRFGQATQGDYTASSENRGGIYSLSGGTATMIAASTDDGTLWKATGSTLASKAFSAATGTLTRGLYYFAFTYNRSAVVTAPALSSLTQVQWMVNGNLTNSLKTSGTTVATTLPASQAASGISAASTIFPIYLY